MQDEQVRLVIEEVQEHAAAMKQLSRCAQLQAGCLLASKLYLQGTTAATYLPICHGVVW